MGSGRRIGSLATETKKKVAKIGELCPNPHRRVALASVNPGMLDTWTSDRVRVRTMDVPHNTKEAALGEPRHGMQA